MIPDWPIGGSDHGATEAALLCLKVLPGPATAGAGTGPPPVCYTNRADAP